MARQSFRRSQLPSHEHAGDHKLLLAVQQYKRRLKLAKEFREPEVIAAERVRELMWDVGAENDWHRWMAAAFREIAGKDATCYRSLSDVAQGRSDRLGLKVVKQIAQHTGIPLGVFYDEDV